MRLETIDNLILKFSATNTFRGSRKFLRKFRYLARFKFTANRVTDERINDPFPSKASENISSQFVVVSEHENSSVKSFRTLSHQTAKKEVG